MPPVKPPPLRRLLLCNRRGEDWFENMVGEKANDRDGDAVASDVIGFVVIVRQHVLFWQTHETRGFPRRKQARPHLLSLDNHDRLTAGAARGGSQTAGYVVEADFRALNLASSLVKTRAFVDGAHKSALGTFRGVEL